MARHKSGLREAPFSFLFAGNFPPGSSVSAHFLSFHLSLARTGVARFEWKKNKIKKNSKSCEQLFMMVFRLAAKWICGPGEVIGHLCEDDYHGSVYFARRGENGKKSLKK